jgi:hypothetical protein
MRGVDVNWDDYHTAGANDYPIHDVVAMVNSLHACGWWIIGLTAIPDKFRQLTMTWLINHFIAMDELLMRPDEAFHPAPEIKLALVQERFGDKIADEVAFLLEDREDVCEAFQALGITTLQVRGRQS